MDARNPTTDLPPLPQHSYYALQQHAKPTEGNELAVAAGVLGIISIFAFGVIPGAVAIVLGAIGTREAQRLGGKNHRWAITGVVFGMFGIVIWGIIVAVTRRPDLAGLGGL